MLTSVVLPLRIICFLVSWVHKNSDKVLIIFGHIVYAAFMPRIKTGRSFTVESMCDFTESEHMPKVVVLLHFSLIFP